MGKQPINIIDRNFYTKFKREYNRICKKLKKDCITQRDYDRNTNYYCLKILMRETGKPFGQLVRNVKRETIRIYMTEKQKKRFTKKALKLRLEGYSYP